MFEGENTEVQSVDTGTGNDSAPSDVGTDLAPTQAEAQGPVDLDKVDEFTIAGQKMTKEQLMASIMRQQDYSRKTQAFSQERKFYDNLSYDIANVLKNPSLIDQFKKIYPEKFHRYLDAYSDYLQTKKDPAQTSQTDPQLMTRINQIEDRFRQQEVKSAEVALDGIFKKFSDKYPFAEEASVVSRALALMEHKKSIGEQEDLTQSDWDSVFKGENDRVEKLASSRYNQKVGTQLKANRKAKDSAVGGGLAGASPARMTMKEATETAIRDLTR